MKTFEDLKFTSQEMGPIMAKSGPVKQAWETFKNGYGVSVLCGARFYSNGVDSYEVAILRDGSIDYDTGIADDILGYLSKDEVTGVMRRVQGLKKWRKTQK